LGPAISSKIRRANGKTNPASQIPLFASNRNKTRNPLGKTNKRLAPAPIRHPQLK
jgi:hypothetical protein